MEETSLPALVEYLEVLCEYYGIRHENLSFRALGRRVSILQRIRQEEAKRGI